MHRLRTRLAAHQHFLILLLLFASFRFFAILTLRTGGLVADFSDYDFYHFWGQLGAMGYRTYDTLWTAYPPLFPALMLPIFEVSARIPPWIDHRLFFHLLFGTFLLIFESGNLIWIYRLAGRLYTSETATNFGGMQPALWVALLYTLLFVPAYTLLGWFEPMPLFFMLLGLELLLRPSRAWVGSAVAAALGFLIKLTPALLAPIAIRWLGARLSLQAARTQWFRPGAPGNLLRPLLYLLLFAGVVIGIGYPLVRANPELAFSSFRIQALRPPWQSVWALIDGFYGYGLVPLDMRNLVSFQERIWVSRIPWSAVTVAFALLYLWLYTRPYDWTNPRTPVVFAAVSVIWLFLYSKGWSPQFLVWVLTFIVLLMPTLRGVLLALLLSFINILEAYGFLIILPDETWLMVYTVLARTVLLFLLAAEFLLQIWPAGARRAGLRRAGRALLSTAMIGSVLAVIALAPRGASAYQERRLREHLCPDTLAHLRDPETLSNAPLVSEDLALWREFYPWLRQRYTLHVVDSYSPIDELPETVLGRNLDLLTDQGEILWLDQGESLAASTYLTRSEVLSFDEGVTGPCRLLRVLRVQPEAPTTSLLTEGGPIELLHLSSRASDVDGSVEVVIIWQADERVQRSYTVFTQLFDAAGEMVAQQDNLPVQGLAPTDSWTPGTPIRDAYKLQPTVTAGRYVLHVGLYDSDGVRVPVAAEDGGGDHIAFEVLVP